MSVSAIVTLVFVLVYYAACFFMIRGLRITTKDLCIAGITVAVALVLDSIRIPLPTGSSWNLCTPIPLMFLAIVWDCRLTIVAGWVCGLVSLFINPLWQPVHWAQLFVEHLICFSCFGFAGIFKSFHRGKLIIGLTIASLFSVLGHTFSGVLFFSQNAWDGWGAWAYSLTYNLSQNIPICILSSIIILALPLKKLAHILGKEN